MLLVQIFIFVSDMIQQINKIDVFLLHDTAMILFKKKYQPLAVSHEIYTFILDK